jgi:hypothetical protein
MRNRPRIGQELLDVPMGDMIRQMAFAIAEAQLKLDENSIEVAQMMGGLKTIYDDNGNVTFTDSRVFFGKEKVRLGDAIDLFNSSTSLGFKSELWPQIRALVDKDNTPASYGSSIESVTAQTLPTKTQSGIIYYTGTFLGTGGKYYRFIGFEEGTTTAKHEEVSELEVMRVKVRSGQSVAATTFIPSRVSMLELGFSPTFYQFVDTIIEVKIAIKYTAESSSTTNVQTNNRQVIRSGSVGLGGSVLGGGIKARIGATSESSRTVVTSQVNATYSQKYSYSAEGSSLLRTKLVPIPPPAMLEERVRQIMENYDEEKAVDPTLTSGT